MTSTRGVGLYMDWCGQGRGKGLCGVQKGWGRVKLPKPAENRLESSSFSQNVFFSLDQYRHAQKHDDGSQVYRFILLKCVEIMHVG